MAHREGVTTATRDWTMVHASALVKNQKVVTIDGAMPVEEACNVLVEHNISSAPVYNGHHEAKDHAITHPRSYVGMIDYGDFMSYILLVLQKCPAPINSGENVPGDTFEVKDIVRRALAGQSIPVKLASDLSRKNPFYSILPEATLLSAMEEFACGIHRVCVMAADGEVLGILSQSTVVQYLFDNRKSYSDIEQLMNQTLRQLNLGEADVIAVGAESIVLDALSLMRQYGVSSVAVLGNNGEIVGNISMTDVKSYRYQLLWTRCFQFVRIVRTQQGIDDGQDRLPVFDVRLDTTLGYATAKLLATKSHRVWVTDERDRAIGVVSLTDIIRVIAASAGINIRAEKDATKSTPS
ncbi:uncharacterized protein BYT42DRAFT_179008 [Radiomyces spectabilis]|uniref:uncharacterized protein n=1 Tax=Radiomyces spectabilis TaxID=64574 RepID=UPI00221F5E2C|nr:uncharacterized protein BYT42DRAFT_179008 [Radiomyces spectabilis]KAI8391021.1 hypothetical protein BYT42DRAFT_179008 [Radiomyces spectabilis]